MCGRDCDLLKSKSLNSFLDERRYAPFIDSSGAKPPNFSQRQKTLTLILILIENAGFSPAFIYEAEGFV
jgi:hypothetical protein